MSDIELGDNVEFRENSNGELVLEHTPSGATLVYDSSAGAWTVGDFAATSVNTEQQNNNEVNLTSLVEDGTYTDILDAIVSEPANQPNGVELVIEPGTYDVSTEYTLTESYFGVSAKGNSHIWNTSIKDQCPVVINWTGATGNGERVLTIGDGNSQVQGVGFKNIKFSGGADTYIAFGGDGGNVTTDLRFERVVWAGSNSYPIESINGFARNFNHKYIDCGWHHNADEAQLGDQAEIRGGELLVQSGNVGINMGSKSSLWGLSGTVKGASTGVKTRYSSKVAPDNLKGVQDAGSVGLEVSHSSPFNTFVAGTYHNMDTGIKVSGGAVTILNPSLANTVSSKVSMEGSNLSHNGSAILGLTTTAVDYTNSTLQKVIQLGPPQSNIDPASVPPGYVGMDDNYDGNGNEALILGTNQFTIGGPWYISVDGTL